MPSLIQPYEYDIFISYRQKDNKGDHWVSGFVTALKDELDAAFKDDLNIYFDENPRDGLHEMHDVDDSLKEKIKCLLFIPILSRTYCDPQSFAWQHEFLPFRDFASNDTFGLKIKLANGNVASRILPVRIYELSTEDTALFEAETKGHIRAIDFVFKSAGVNRPLLPADKKEENLGHTVYRDQVNKMANVIGDILTAMRRPMQPLANQTGNKQENYPPSPISSRKRIWASLLGAMVIAAGIWTAGKFMGGHQNQMAEVPDKSIAVLPFSDISETHDQAYFSDGMMIEILDHLFKIKDLRIIPRNSTLRYKDSSKSLKEIASELGVAHLIQGSVRKSGNRVKISVQLMNGNNEQSLWQQTYDREIADVFAVQSDIASQVANALRIQITPEVKERMEAIPTQNQEAYELYLKGRKEYTAWSKDFNMDRVKSGIGFLKSAISLDSTFSNAYAALGNCYWVLGHHDPDYTVDHWKKSKEYSSKAIELDPQNGWAYTQLAVVQNDWEWDRKAAYSSYRKSIALNPSDLENWSTFYWFHIRSMNCDSMAAVLNTLKKLDPTREYYGLEVFLRICNRDENALRNLKSTSSFGGLFEIERLIILKEYKQALEKITVNKSSLSDNYFLLLKGEILGLSGQKAEAMQVIGEMEQLSRQRHIWPSFFAHLYMAAGEEEKAYQYLEKAKREHDLDLHLLPYFATFYLKNDDPRFQAFMKRTWIN